MQTARAKAAGLIRDGEEKALVFSFASCTAWIQTLLKALWIYMGKMGEGMQSYFHISHLNTVAFVRLETHCHEPMFPYTVYAHNDMMVDFLYVLYVFLCSENNNGCHTGDFSILDLMRVLIENKRPRKLNCSSKTWVHDYDATQETHRCN